MASRAQQGQAALVLPPGASSGLSHHGQLSQKCRSSVVRETERVLDRELDAHKEIEYREGEIREEYKRLCFSFKIFSLKKVRISKDIEDLNNIRTNLT